MAIRVKRLDAAEAPRHWLARRKLRRFPIRNGEADWLTKRIYFVLLQACPLYSLECRQRLDKWVSPQPRPTSGILVAMTVMNRTFASSGRLAMCSTDCATCSTSITGSAARVPLACGTP